MTQIILSEFLHYSKNSLQVFLKLQNEIDFQIVFPRNFSLEKDDYLDIVNEFSEAALICQVFSQLTDNISYNVPSPHNKKPFIFEVRVSDIVNFAEKLFYIVSGLYDGGNELDCFQVRAAELLRDAFDGNSELEIFCGGLVDIAARYLLLSEDQRS